MTSHYYRPALTILTAVRSDDVTITVSGDIDITTADQLMRRLARVLDAQPRRLCIDLAGSRYIDVAGCHTLFRAARALPPDRILILRSPSRLACRVFQLTGLDQLWRIEHPISWENARPDTARAPLFASAGMPAG